MASLARDILQALPLKRNGAVLDIGCGIGTLTKEAGLLVPDGKVVALEIDKLKLETVAAKARQKGLSHIKTLCFDVDGGRPLPFSTDSFDAVILSHVLRHIVYRESLLKECQRVLRPGGVLLVLESKEDAFGVSAHPDTRILFDDMLEYLDRAGFLLGETFDTRHEEYGIIGVCSMNHDA